MATEYYHGFGREPRKKHKRNLFMWLVDVLLTALTVIVATAMLLSFLVPYVNPTHIWFLPILGITATWCYVVTLLLALYWSARWRWKRAALMWVLVLIGSCKVTLFWHPVWQRDTSAYEQQYRKPSRPDPKAFRLMTYNIRNFYSDCGGSTADSILMVLDSLRPDIICLQEFNVRVARRSGWADSLHLQYAEASFGLNVTDEQVYRPLRILYRPKIHLLRSGVILDPTSAVWADFVIGKDTVRILNNHLRSTAIKASDSDYITTTEFISDTARDDKIRSIVDRYRENSVLRAEQVDSIAKFVAATTTRHIICGDFNDTPLSYVYHTMAKGKTDAFAACGKGYSYTYRGFFNTLRIDYVLSSPLLEPQSYEVPYFNFSDHLPVVVRFVCTKEEETTKR